MVAAHDAVELVDAAHDKVEGVVAAHDTVEHVLVAHDAKEAAVAVQDKKNRTCPWRLRSIGTNRSGKCTIFTAVANSK